MPGKPGRPYGSCVQRAVAFGAWCAHQPKPPTTAQVREHLGASIETAKRWRRAYLRALPIQPPATKEPT